MNKEKLIEIAHVFGLTVDLDKWDDEVRHSYIRFRLTKSQFFKDIIIYKNWGLEDAIQAFQEYLEEYGEYKFKERVKQMFL